MCIRDSTNNAYVCNTDAMIDSGACRSIICRSFYKKLCMASPKREDRPIVLPVDLDLRSISGQKLKVYGLTELYIILNGKYYLARFYIVDDSSSFSQDVLLGTDVIKELPILINAKHDIVHVCNDSGRKVRDIPLVISAIRSYSKRSDKQKPFNYIEGSLPQHTHPTYSSHGHLPSMHSQNDFRFKENYNFKENGRSLKEPPPPGAFNSPDQGIIGTYGRDSSQRSSYLDRDNSVSYTHLRAHETP